MSSASRQVSHCSPDFFFFGRRGSVTPCVTSHAFSFSRFDALSTAPSVSCLMRSSSSARACAASADAAVASGASMHTPRSLISASITHTSCSAAGSACSCGC